MLPPSLTKHQRISMRLSSALIAFLQGKHCEVFSEPFDVELHQDEITRNKVVIPDIIVIRDKTGLTDQK
nr:Uma2 family endonuclease [Alicyclobacillus hesperidum]